MGSTMKNLAGEYLDATLYQKGIDNDALVHADDELEKIEKGEESQLGCQLAQFQARIDSLEQQKGEMQALLAKPSDSLTKKNIGYRIDSLDQEQQAVRNQMDALKGLKDSVHARVKSSFEDALWGECVKNGVIRKDLADMGVTGKNYHGMIRSSIFRLENARDTVATTQTLGCMPGQIARDLLDARFDVGKMGFNYPLLGSVSLDLDVTNEDKILYAMTDLKMLQEAWEETPPELRSSKMSPKQIVQDILWNAASYDETKASRELRVKYSEIGINGPEDIDRLVPAILRSADLNPKVKNDWLAWWNPKEELPLEKYVAEARSFGSFWHGVKKTYFNDVVVWGHEHLEPYMVDNPGKSAVIGGATASVAALALYFGKGALPVALKWASQYPKIVAGAQILFGGLTGVSLWKTGKKTIDGATSEDPEKSSKLLEEGGGETPMRLLELALVALPFAKGSKGVATVAEDAEAIPLVTKKATPGYFEPIEGDPSVTMKGMDTIEAPASTTMPDAEPIAARKSLPKELEDWGIDSTTKVKKPPVSVDGSNPTLENWVPSTKGKPYYTGPSLGGAKKNPVVIEGIADNLTARLDNMVSGEDPIPDIPAMESFAANARQRLQEAGKIYAASGDVAGEARVAAKLGKLNTTVVAAYRRFDVFKELFALRDLMKAFLKVPVVSVSKLDSVIGDIEAMRERLVSPGYRQEAAKFCRDSADFIEFSMRKAGYTGDTAAFYTQKFTALRAWAESLSKT